VPEYFRVPLKTQYALRAMFDLSLAPPAQPVKIADIARRQKIPQKFLELILTDLKQGGFVESKRGAEGGYYLARSPETITVGAVIRHMNLGDGGRNRAHRTKTDPLAGLWRQVDEALFGVLGRITFAELVREWQEQQSEIVLTWEI